MSLDEAERTEESPRKWRWWTPELVFLAIPLLAIGVIWLGVQYQKYSNSERKRKVDYVQAHNNAKQIYMLLVDFDQDYGQFPNASTATQVKQRTESNAFLDGTSSNAIFRQLIAGGYIQSEEIFFAKNKGTKKPDNVIDGGRALSTGECGFAYVASSSGPVLIAPAIPGTTRFDREVFQGKAVILSKDGSVKPHDISSDGHIYINDMDILDPRQPYWGGKAPVIAYPE